MTHLEPVKSWAVCEVLRWVSEMETLQSHEEESCAGTATFPERGWWGYCNLIWRSVIRTGMSQCGLLALNKTPALFSPSDLNPISFLLFQFGFSSPTSVLFNYVNCFSC